jgi:hypothetical protein
MVACSKGATGIVELLLAVPGVDVNAAKVSCVSGTCLHAVISHRHVRWEPEVKQYGCRCGWVRGREHSGELSRCCVQKVGRTALMEACSKGATDIVELLLAVPGVDVNVANVSCVSGKRLHVVMSHRHVRSLRA